MNKVGGRFGPGDLDTPHDASTLEVQAGEEILLVQHVQLVPQLFRVPNFSAGQGHGPCHPLSNCFGRFERNPILGQGLGAEARGDGQAGLQDELLHAGHMGSSELPVTRLW